MDWLTIMHAIRAWVVGGSGLPDGSVVWKYGSIARPVAPFIELSIMDMRQIAHDYILSAWNPLQVSSEAIAPTVSGNTFTATAHPYVSGDGPFTITTSGTMPTPFTVSTDYYVIVIDANTIRLAASFQDTVNLIPVVLTGVGSGTITLVPSDDTVRYGKEIQRTAIGQRECTIEMQAFGPEGSVYVAQQLLTNVLASLSLYADALDQAGVGITDLGVAYINGGVRLLEGKRGSILEPRAICEASFFTNVSATDFITFVETAQIAVKPQAPDGSPLPEQDFTIGS